MTDHREMMMALNQSAEQATTTIEQLKEHIERYKDRAPIVSSLLEDQVELFLERVSLARSCQNLLVMVKNHSMHPAAGSVLCSGLSRNIFEINKKLEASDHILRSVLTGLFQNVEA